MSDDPTGIGLSDPEAGQLMRLSHEYQSRVGYNVSDPAVWFGNHLSGYLSALCVAAAIENQRSQQRLLVQLQRESTRLRQDSMLAFESHLGRTPTADDLVQELSRFVTVPEFASEAIRRDVDRLLA